MNKLKTMYMGIELNNPIILGASNLVTDPDNLKKAEEMGAGAIVYKSPVCRLASEFRRDIRRYLISAPFAWHL
jgi:dihydroorotate dehydrogenase